MCLGQCEREQNGRETPGHRPPAWLPSSSAEPQDLTLALCGQGKPLTNTLLHPQGQRQSSASMELRLQGLAVPRTPPEPCSSCDSPNVCVHFLKHYIRLRTHKHCICPWARENCHPLWVFPSAVLHHHQDTKSPVSFSLGTGFALCVSSSAPEPEFPWELLTLYVSEGAGDALRNCRLGSFLATRHPPQSGKVPPSLQEGRRGVLRPPDFVVDPREPLQRSG